MKPLTQTMRPILPSAPFTYDPANENALRKAIADALERGSATAGAYPLSSKGVVQCYLTLDSANNPIFLGADGLTVLANMAVFLSLKAVQTSTSSTQEVVRVTVTDFLPRTTASLVITPSAVGCTVSPNTASAALVSGGFVDYTITRPAAGSGPGRVVFTATDTTGGRLTNFDVVDVTPGDVIVPTIDVAITTSATTYSVAFTTTGTVTSQIDAGGFSAAVSPVVVTRNGIGGADQVLTLKSVLNGQTETNSITVPAQVLGTVSLTGVNPTKVDGTHYTVDWSTSGMPTGTTFNITGKVDGINAVQLSNGNAIGSNPVTITLSTGSLGAGPTGLVTVDAIYAGKVIATAKGPPAGVFSL